MKLDVLFSPAGLASHEVAGRPVFVIDILRSTTVIAAALFRGARAVVPVATAEEASRLAQNLDRGRRSWSASDTGSRLPGSIWTTVRWRSPNNGSAARRS